MIKRDNPLPTALEMQHVDLIATITPRAKTAEQLAAAKARVEELARKRAAGETPDPDDEGDADEIYDISLSSDSPINRGWYTETLDHSKDAVNLDRAKSGINLLWNHDTNQPIGRINNLAVKSGKLGGEMRFFSTPSAQEKRTMVNEGLREVSVGYSVESYEYTPGTADAGDSYIASRWTPLEGSLAPVPADNSVGASRRSVDTAFPVLVRSTTPPPAVSQEKIAMNEQERAAAEAAALAKAKLPGEVARLLQKYGMADKTADFIERGLSLDQVREAILEAKTTDTRTQTGGSSTNTGVDLSGKEQRQFSYCRAIAAALDLREGKRPEMSLEIEVSNTLERTLPSSYKRRGGVLIPMSLRNAGLQQYNGGGLSPAVRQAVMTAVRAGVLDSATVNALREVVFTEYGGELIEILRNMALVIAMGARTLGGLSGPVAFPRQLTDSIAQWIAENPTAGTLASSNPTTDLVTLAPHSLMANTAYSRQLIVQSSIDVEAFVRASIGAAHALARDLAAIHGTGLNSQPLGIYNQPGVATVDFSNAAFGNGSDKIAYTGCVEMEVLVANANALLGTLGYMTTPGIAGDAKTTLKFPAAAIAQGGILWNGKLQDGEMNGYTARATNQVSKTMGANGAASGGSNHGLIYGNWADVLIGEFGGAMELIVDPYSLKKQALIEVTSFEMVDVAIRHPGSFAVGTNLLA
jgi:HK97 family phage major capsid protein/HK97 family phage prohead protease